MALHRVPGSKGKYLADDAGIREIGQSDKLGEVALTAALRGAALGRQYDPDGKYEAERRTVRGGYYNEPRAGAVVRQVVAGPDAGEKEIMLQILAGMESQRGSSRIP